GLQPLVMVVDRDREHFLGALLADHVFVEDLLDLVGLRQLVARALGAILELLTNDVVTQLHAFVADEHGGAGDELADLVLALPAEGAVEELTVIVAAAGIVTHRRPSFEACDPCIARGAPARQSTRTQLSRCKNGTCMMRFTLAAHGSFGLGCPGRGRIPPQRRFRGDQAGFPAFGPVASGGISPRLSRTRSMSP